MESNNVFVGVEPIPHFGIYEKEDYKMMGKLFYHKMNGFFSSATGFLPNSLKNCLANLEEQEKKKELCFKSKKAVIQYFDGSVFKSSERLMNHSSMIICF